VRRARPRPCVAAGRFSLRHSRTRVRHLYRAITVGLVSDGSGSQAAGATVTSSVRASLPSRAAQPQVVLRGHPAALPASPHHSCP
jgi:hypothetical protein